MAKPRARKIPMRIQSRMGLLKLIMGRGKTHMIIEIKKKVRTVMVSVPRMKKRLRSSTFLREY